MSINPIQWFLILIAILGVLSGATAQMTDLFGPIVAKDVATGASLLSSLISAILMPLTGQSAQVKNVLAMDGVQHIDVNGSANQTLAALAIDPSVNKIAPTPSAMEQVTATAKGTA